MAENGTDLTPPPPPPAAIPTLVTGDNKKTHKPKSLVAYRYAVRPNTWRFMLNQEKLDGKAQFQMTKPATHLLCELGDLITHNLCAKIASRERALRYLTSSREAGNRKRSVMRKKLQQQQPGGDNKREEDESNIIKEKKQSASAKGSRHTINSRYISALLNDIRCETFRQKILQGIKRLDGSEAGQKAKIRSASLRRGKAIAKAATATATTTTTTITTPGVVVSE